MKQLWRRITDWEHWPFLLIYFPLGIVWLYYVVKARAFWFFSNVNPSIEFSGFEGEGKWHIYEQMPNEIYPSSLLIKAKQPVKTLLKQINQNNFSYPFIVKPDIGMQGMLFRKIEDEKQLLQYHNCVPYEYIVQELVDLPLEFSVFYIRYPGEIKGEITGFIMKSYLSVTGDGHSLLRDLIVTDERAKFRIDEMFKKHAARLDMVIPAGEIYYLSIAGNHNRGAKFVNLHKEIDTNLQSVFDKIGIACEQFYYGRFDIKCTSVEDLKAGKNIAILEYNGTGAEPNHIYDCNMSYGEALKTIAMHWHHMYAIGRINLKKGVPYWSFGKGLKYLKNARKFFKEMNQYDLQCDLSVCNDQPAQSHYEPSVISVSLQD